MDPAIGKGVFFNSLIPMIASIISDVTLYGIDVDSSLVKMAEKTLIPLVEKIPYEMKLGTGDFFLNFPPFLPRKFDVIIGNPPHNALYSRDEWGQIRKLCSFGQNTRIYSESSIFFTLFSLTLLKPSGILCFLLPKPIIYSKRWTEFRRILLCYTLVEVLDLGNQFSGQLQEQCAIILRKKNSSSKNQEYKTRIWNTTDSDFGQISTISYIDALKVDNLLVGVNAPELGIIRRLYGDEYAFLKMIAFRGLSSKYRTKTGKKPLIEKKTISSGFLYPTCSFLHEKTPKEKLKRQNTPKILAQRIISYQTKPKFNLKVKTWVDQKGTKLTHETVINIIPDYSQDILSLFTVAGLLESSFIAWWLQHAVYTKEFVTSKDFDRAYINSIRIPQITGPRNHEYRKKLTKLLEESNLEEIIVEVKNQPVIEHFYTLGELYYKYQCVGTKIKDLIDELMNESNAINYNGKKNYFQNFKKFYQEVTQTVLNSSKSKPQNTHYKEVKIKFEELKELRTFMDDIVSMIYKLTPLEKKIIKGIKAC